MENTDNADEYAMYSQPLIISDEEDINLILAKEFHKDTKELERNFTDLYEINNMLNKEVHGQSSNLDMNSNNIMNAVESSKAGTEYLRRAENESTGITKLIVTIGIGVTALFTAAGVYIYGNRKNSPNLNPDDEK